MRRTNPSDSVPTENILIVDDDQDTCQLLEILFQREGYRTAVAYGGQQALNHVETAEPDLVVLDVMMPEMDGWETFRRLRDISSAPVLFLTAMASGESAAMALGMGAEDYLRKPYSPPELLGRVNALLTRSKTGLMTSENGHHGTKAPGTPNVLAVIPAYNEERFIGSVVLKAAQFAGQVVVVDDGSTDATAEVAQKAGALVVRHHENRGKGAALSTAFSLTSRFNPDVVVMLDADGQHLPEELSLVIDPVLKGEADIVIGSRYLNGASHVPRLRSWGHRAFNAFTNFTSGVSVSDSQSGFRAFSPQALGIISLHSNGFSVESEMQFLAKERDLRLVEVPVTIQYTDRPKRPVLYHGTQVLNGLLRLVGQYRPLLFFGVPGVILLLLGFGMGVIVVNIYQRTDELAVGYAMISVLLTLVGMLSLSTGIILHSVRGLLIDQFTQGKRTKR
jgi:DNA-binding response OmpR family regulator